MCCGRRDLRDPVWAARPSADSPKGFPPFLTQPPEAPGLLSLPSLPGFWEWLCPFLYPTRPDSSAMTSVLAWSELTTRRHPAAAQSLGRSMVTGAIWGWDVVSPGGGGGWWTKETATV